MRGHPAILLVAAAVGLSAGACGASSGPPPPPLGAAPPTIEVSHLNQFKAEVLTNRAGFPLYVFQPDHRRGATCKGTCAAIWPPVFVSVGQRAAAGPGVQPGLLGRDPCSRSRSVVTYNGWPLYTYVSDIRPGVASGQGVNLNGGYWYVMPADGTVIVPVGDPPAG